MKTTAQTKTHARTKTRTKTRTKLLAVSLTTFVGAGLGAIVENQRVEAACYDNSEDDCDLDDQCEFEVGHRNGGCDWEYEICVGSGKIYLCA